MKKVLVILMVAWLAGAAFADETHVRTAEPVMIENSRDDWWTLFYDQPYSSELLTINASTAYESELVDDIPSDLGAVYVDVVTAAVSEWDGDWVDPWGVTLTIYDDSCPPGLYGAPAYYFPWGELDPVLIYEDPGWQTVYEITMILPERLYGAGGKSLGFVVDNSGPGTPFAGFVMTEEYPPYGDCEAYWDGTYWSAPRWTPVSSYFGISVNVAYCLGQGCISPAAETTWGSIKALYK